MPVRAIAKALRAQPPSGSAELPDFSGWDELAEAHARFPMQSPLWMQACAEAFGEPLRTVVCGERNHPVALAPLVVRRRLETLGVMQLGEPTDMLASSPAAMEELVAAMLADGRALRLERLPADSEALAAFRRLPRTRAEVRSEPVAGHPAIALSEAWQEPGGGLSSRRRSDLRRARRRAEALGEIEIELLAPAEAEVAKLIEQAAAIEARSWKGRGGSAIAANPHLLRFFVLYGSAAARRGLLRVQFLRIAGRRVAMQVNVEWKRSAWTLKIGYDEEFRDASPGQLLLAESIADAARRGLESYELLGRQEAWTDVWSRDIRECVRLLVYPSRPTAVMLLARDTLRRVLSERRSQAAGSQEQPSPA